MSINVNVPNRLEPNEKIVLDQASESIQILKTLYRQYLIELNNIHNGMYNRKTLLNEYKSIIHKIYKCIASTTTMDKLIELQSTRTNLLFGVPFNLKLNNHANLLSLNNIDRINPRKKSNRTHKNNVKPSNNKKNVKNTRRQQNNKALQATVHASSSASQAASASSSSINDRSNPAADAIQKGIMMMEANKENPPQPLSQILSSQNNSGIIKKRAKNNSGR
jgi:hypothetical protein